VSTGSSITWLWIARSLDPKILSHCDRSKASEGVDGATCATTTSLQRQDEGLWPRRRASPWRRQTPLSVVLAPSFVRCFATRPWQRMHLAASMDRSGADESFAESLRSALRSESRFRGLRPKILPVRGGSASRPDSFNRRLHRRARYRSRLCRNTAESAPAT